MLPRADARRMTSELEDRIAQGAGETAADLVVRDVRLLDLVTGQLVETDIAIAGDTIVGTYGRYRGRRIVDGGGRIAVPGFIDSHLHIESSLVTPFEFDRCVLPHGVTTAIWDPHELANVCGTAALDYALDCASRTVMDIRVALSSCVPSTSLETAGARIEADDLAPYLSHAGVVGLAEFMNYPGVLARDPASLRKIAAWSGRHIDGHAPLLRGLALNAYVAAGIRTEHEATSADEALEKLRKGLTVLIREGSVCKDLDALAPLLDLGTSPFLALCTDDRNPLDIAREGHLDDMIRRLIAHGAPPLAAYRAASLSAAQAFNLRDRGMIAPGRRADIVLVGDLAQCDVSLVIAGGVVADAAAFDRRETIPPIGLDSIRSARLDADALRVEGDGKAMPVIGVDAGRIITRHLVRDLPSREGIVDHAEADDVAKVCVLERHGRNGNLARGFVAGFGMRHGAIASSVGHDSHNLCAIGMSDIDMAVAIERIRALGGGFVVVRDGAVRAELALPIAGLMSDQPFEVVRERLEALREAAAALGIILPEPFLQVAFLSLPVIPHLKITDRGLVDVDRMALVTA